MFFVHLIKLNFSNRLDIEFLYELLDLIFKNAYIANPIKTSWLRSKADYAFGKILYERDFFICYPCPACFKFCLPTPGVKGGWPSSPLPPSFLKILKGNAVENLL